MADPSIKKLLLASNNPGKLREFHALLHDLGVELLTPNRLGLELDVEESGQTYAENAQLKAQAFFSASNMLTLADDSGLEVDALGGAPGLYSARYSPKPKASDADRRNYLLAQLEGRPRPWRARFRCFIAMIAPGVEMQLTEGTCVGEIIPEERGANGFGYDPIFLLPELGLTMAELHAEQKNQLSHRARAIQAARPILLGLMENLP